MMIYSAQTNMHILSVWATEVEIFAAANMLGTSIFVFTKCGQTYKWLKFKNSSSADNSSSVHSKKAIYLTNISNQYETFRRM